MPRSKSIVIFDSKSNGETLVPIIERKDAIRKTGLSLKDTQRWYGKWLNLRSSSKGKGVDCALTFLQYLKLAVRARIETPDEIGIYAGKFQLARYTDKGDYTIKSCRFITREENQQEKYKNGGIEAFSKKKKGRTKETDEGVARQARAISGRTKETHDGVARQAEYMRGRTKHNDPIIAAAALKKSKRFKLKSPDGKIFVGTNLSEFCKRNGLNLGNMSSVCTGRLKSTRGWLGKYLEAK